MKSFWQLTIIIIITTLAFANIFQNKFIIDDKYFIEDWSLTRSWSSIPQLLKGANPDTQSGVYRPVRSFLYLVYYQAYGLNPFIYHLHSITTHILTTVLVFFILTKLTKSNSHQNYIPFIGALLFGLHPIHTESITYIAASMEMLGITFALACFLAYLHQKKLFTLIFALLAFFTYEMTLTLPLLIIAYELTLGNKNWSKLWLILNPLVFYLFIRFGVLNIGASRGDYLAYDFYHTQLTMAKVWIKYLWLLIYPVNLSHNHTILPGFEAFMTPYSDGSAILKQSIFDLPILLSITTIASLIYYGYISRPSKPWVTFAICWFFISLLPVAYLLPQGTAIAEKYLYLSSLSTIGIYAIFINWLLINKKNIGIIILLMTIAFYWVQTYSRNKDWRSPRALWEYETRIHPRSELAYFNLGIIYTQQGQRDLAIDSYQKALVIQPNFWEVSNNLNNLLKDKR